MSLNLYFDFDLLGGWQGTLVWVRIMPLLGCITSLISMQKVVRMSLKCFLKFLQPRNFFITGAYILLKFLYLRSTNNFAHMNMNVSFVVGGCFYFSTFSTFPSQINAITSDRQFEVLYCCWVTATSWFKFKQCVVVNHTFSMLCLL